MSQLGNSKQRRKGDAAQPEQGTTMAWQNLPGDIKLEILSRLPPKSLLRFRCVCKRWLSLFSNPIFIHKHLHRTTSAAYDDDKTLLIHNCAPDSAHHGLSLLNLKNPKNPLTFNLNHPFQFPPKNNQCDMDLVGSINGLVCLSSKTDGLISILWNPATDHYVNIPTPNLKFLPNQGGTSIGFCFDSLTNDYKIVRVVCFLEDMELRPRPRVELYSVSTDCWREIEVEVSFDFLLTSCDTIVKGDPYWSAHFHGDPFGVLVWFDVGKEVFREGPPLDVPVQCVDGLVNFKDSVAMLTSAFWSPEGELECAICLFVMEDDSSSWNMKFRGGSSRFMRLVGCTKNGEIILFPFEENVLQLYNPKTQETSNIQTDVEGLRNDFEKYSFEVSNYTASLVPIRGSKQFEKEGTSGHSIKIEDEVA